MQPTNKYSALAALIVVCVVGVANAQIRTIPKEGIEGLPKEAVEFEIEHNYRRENNLGGTVPAEPGTPPASTDPRNIEGVWVVGRTYVVNADGSFTNTLDVRAQQRAQGGAAAPGGAPPGGGGGGARRVQCTPGSPFSMGMPGKIVQTDATIYMFKNNNNDGATYRRIQMNSAHPANLAPSYMGHSIGRWEGDTLVVETVGLKGSMSVGMGGGGGSFTAASKVTERIKKIEGNMTLEDLITIEDPALKEPLKSRLTSYYRPDLRYVEAPCEEYTDPFEGKYLAPTGDSAIRSEAPKP